MTLTEGAASGATGYGPSRGYDEAFSARGAPRPHYADLLAALDDCDLAALAERVNGHMSSNGATFGEGRVFRLDPVPRLLTAGEWTELESGLAQRIRALDAFVADVYGDRRIVQAGVVPDRLLCGIEFHEDLGGIPPPPGAGVALAGPHRVGGGRRPRRRARRRRPLPRARGQRPHAVGHGLRAGRPSRDHRAPAL